MKNDHRCHHHRSFLHVHVLTLLSLCSNYWYLTTSLALALSPIQNKASMNMPMIDLQSQHEILTPAERMRKIASSCELLDINEFDVYGDYSKCKYLYKYSIV